MSRPRVEPLARQVFDTRAMVTAYPLRLQHPHKQLVYRLACPPERPHGGALTVTRWATRPLPATLPEAAPRLEMAARYFDYSASPPGALRWYLNFADAHLFGYYGGPLLAQDELQVAEHPALGALREAMDDSDVPYLAPLTTEPDGQRTPVLIGGVERRCVIATDPDAAAGRPEGLYGNRFARAAPEIVARAVTPLWPPTITNLVALEAPAHGRGRYTEAQIVDVLENAATGFGAAVDESGGAAIVHTGFWGCGAYGGNRTLMALLQLVAARVAGLTALVFHTVDDAGLADFARGRALYDAIPAGAALPGVVDDLVARDFFWGESDGN